MWYAKAAHLSKKKKKLNTSTDTNTIGRYLHNIITV